MLLRFSFFRLVVTGALLAALGVSAWAEDPEPFAGRGLDGDIDDPPGAVHGYPVYAQGNVSQGVPLHDGQTAQEQQVARGVRRLQAIDPGVVQPLLMEPAEEIVALRRIADFHQAEHVGMDRGDHHGHGLFFGFRLSRVGHQLPVDAARHPQVVLHVVGGDPDIAALDDGRGPCRRRNKRRQNRQE